MDKDFVLKYYESIKVFLKDKDKENVVENNPTLLESYIKNKQNIELDIVNCIKKYLFDLEEVFKAESDINRLEHQTISNNFLTKAKEQLLLAIINTTFKVYLLHKDNEKKYLLKDNILNKYIPSSDIDNSSEIDNLIDNLHSLYLKKNSDYGNSFTFVRARISNAIMVRLYDKYNRIDSLLHKDINEVKDESVNDTLIDLINYCILELLEINYEKALTNTQ